MADSINNFSNTKNQSNNHSNIHEVPFNFTPPSTSLSQYDQIVEVIQANLKAILSNSMDPRYRDYFKILQEQAKSIDNLSFNCYLQSIHWLLGSEVLNQLYAAISSIKDITPSYATALEKFFPKEFFFRIFSDAKAYIDKITSLANTYLQCKKFFPSGIPLNLSAQYQNYLQLSSWLNSLATLHHKQ